MDCGLKAIEEAFQRLYIDERWSRRTERGFAWWSWGLRQEVWAEKPFREEGIEIVRVHARTDVMRDYHGTKQQKFGLRMQMPMCTLSGFVRVPEEPTRIQLASSVYVNEGTVGWMGEFLSWVVMVQNCEAILAQPLVTEVIQTTPDITPHPASGLRHDLDDMTNLIEQVVAPLGREPSKWTGKEMAEIVEAFQGPPTVMLNGDENGLTSELPCLGMTSMIRLITREFHPRLGNGLLASLSWPRRNLDDPVETCLSLNERELVSHTRSHFLGTWCISPSNEVLTYSSFWPNAVYKPGMAWNLYGSLFQRARWLAEDEYGDDWRNGGFETALRNKMELWGIRPSD